MQNIKLSAIYLSSSASLEESLNPLAKGLESILSLVMS